MAVKQLSTGVNRNLQKIMDEAKGKASEPLKRVQVEMPLELHNQFKQECARSNVTMSSLIVSYVRELVSEAKEDSRK